MKNKLTMKVLSGGLALSVSLVWAMSVWPGITFAQGSAPNKPSAREGADPALFTFKVAHDHRIGKGIGELRITESGISYRGESADEERHSQVWRDTEVKRLGISKTQLRITAYEAARIPLIPGEVPFSRGGKSVRAGSERTHLFRLLESEITPDVVNMLLARFKRPITTSVIPKENEESGKLLFEIPVFHRRRAGGESGSLHVYEDHLIFTAEAEDRSRYWRYEDIRDIGRLGRYQFEIATYEAQFASDGKSYIFDLKRPMTDTEYDTLWKRVYEREQSPRLRPAPGRVKAP